MKNNTDTFYKDAKKVCKNVEIKTLGDYHDLHVQSNIILIADIFKNFSKKFIEIYQHHPAHFYLHLD